MHDRGTNFDANFIDSKHVKIMVDLKMTDVRGTKSCSIIDTPIYMTWNDHRRFL